MEKKFNLFGTNKILIITGLNDSNDLLKRFYIKKIKCLKYSNKSYYDFLANKSFDLIDQQSSNI